MLGRLGYICMDLGYICTYAQVFKQTVKDKEGEQEGNQFFFIRDETADRKMMPENSESGNNERTADFNVK